MSDLTGLIGQALQGNVLSQLSQQIGANEQQTQSAAMAAIPMILGGLKRNAATPEGASALASALQNDHDGSILDDLGGFLGGTFQNQRATNGAGILGHILGGQQNNVQQGLSQASGLDLSQIAKLLPLLAPIVMGALGRSQRQQTQQPQQSGGGLLDMLTGATSNARQQAPSGALDMLSGFLDADGDGDVKDDLLKQAGSSILGKIFGR